MLNAKYKISPTAFLHVPPTVIPACPPNCHSRMILAGIHLYEKQEKRFRASRNDNF